MFNPGLIVIFSYIDSGVQFRGRRVLPSQCSIPVPNSMPNFSFNVGCSVPGFKNLCLVLVFILMVAVQRQGGPTIASLGRDSPVSELDCHHNSQCQTHCYIPELQIGYSEYFLDCIIIL